MLLRLYLLALSPVIFEYRMDRNRLGGNSKEQKAVEVDGQLLIQSLC